jgi:hypothetical protein
MIDSLIETITPLVARCCGEIEYRIVEKITK